MLGAVGRFWSLSWNQPLRTIRSREDFVAFAEPGFAKAAMAFVVTPEGTGSRLVTETRVVGSPASHAPLPPLLVRHRLGKRRDPPKLAQGRSS